MTVSPDVFRARKAEELAGLEHLGHWFEDWIEPSRAVTLANDTRPWTPSGREWAGFAETLCRVLAWYKGNDSTAQARTRHHFSRFRDLGWRLRPDAIDRVSRALQHVVDCARVDPSLPEARRTFLEAYDVGPIARYTAIDDRFQTLTEQPIRTVLDFGSGMARQAFLWIYGRSDVKLYSVDAIESIYLLQTEIYRRLFPDRTIEYFAEPDFEAALAGAPAGAVVHLPTWRLAAVPDASVDLVICVQILQELKAPTVRHLLGEFRRIVRPGGLLYIRDKEFWTPAHTIRIGRALLTDGWRLVFRYTGDEGTDIEGVPRLWVNAGDDPARYFRLAARLKRAFLPSYSRSFRSWRDLGLPI